MNADDERKALIAAFRILCGLSVTSEMFDCFTSAVPMRWRQQPVEMCALKVIRMAMEENEKLD